jgi:hypothetical protein
VEWVFFPLDEELGLLPGSLTPKQQENLVHLGSWMPFEQAGFMLERLVGVQVSDATVRRLTERSGACVEATQTIEQDPSEQAPSGFSGHQKLAFSADGAYVPLLKGEWAEVRTLAIGEVAPAKKTRETQEVEVTALSYFSRMAPASAFMDLASREMQRRAVGEAQAVCAVTDGAEWLQGFIDLHRPDAVRILDFPHAAEHLSALLEALQQAGVVLPEKALDRSLHVLKHRGPTWLFRTLANLPAEFRERDAVREHLSYLSKREALMQYQHYRRQGWPIGSGMVESANKVVVQARLKGAGMHWAPAHVNPMLALRTSVCNDRWPQAWSDGEQRLFSQRALQHKQKALSHLWTLASALAWVSLRLRPSSPPTPLPTSLRLPASPPAMIAGTSRPSPHHPWKRAVVAYPKGSAKN